MYVIFTLMGEVLLLLLCRMNEGRVADHFRGDLLFIQKKGISYCALNSALGKPHRFLRVPSRIAFDQAMKIATMAVSRSSDLGELRRALPKMARRTMRGVKWWSGQVRSGN
jgi:hypothetical protein